MRIIAIVLTIAACTAPSPITEQSEATIQATDAPGYRITFASDNLPVVVPAWREVAPAIQARVADRIAITETTKGQERRWVARAAADRRIVATIAELLIDERPPGDRLRLAPESEYSDLGSGWSTDQTRPSDLELGDITIRLVDWREFYAGTSDIILRLLEGAPLDDRGYSILRRRLADWRPAYPRSCEIIERLVNSTRRTR